MKLAIDVGGVIANKQHEGQPEPDSLDILIRLSEVHDLWIVSMCGIERELNTRRWLCDNGYDKAIGVDKWKFVRYQDKKSRILLRYNLDLLLDDRTRHLIDARSVGVKGVHYIGQYNNCNERCGFPNVFGWEDFYQYMQK